MAQRPEFDIKASTLIPLMDSLGVLEMGEEEKASFIGVYFDQDPTYSGLYVILAEEGITYYELTLDQIETLGLTDGYIFISDGVDHILRKLQGADGLWMSDYQTELPVEVLSRMVISASSDTIVELVNIELPDALPEFEAIYAYYDEKISRMVSLVYMSSYGIYARTGSDWILEDISAPSYQSLDTFEISSEKADEFIQMFDENYGNLTLEQVKEFEVVDLDGGTEDE